VAAVLESKPDSPTVVIGINENKLTRFDLMDCVRKTQAVGKCIEKLDFEGAMNLRGDEYKEAYDTFIKISNFKNDTPPGDKKLRIAIVHVGAPAAGMNIATQVAVRIGIESGHTMLGIRGGFEGLINGDVAELTWQDVSGWALSGGSNLRTNRSQPNLDTGLTAYNLQKFDINCLVIIGGFEAFTSALQLVKARDQYPQFCIPLLNIPATISNNVPGTEYSLGSDTSLNTIVNACDLIKMSASSSSKRVFVVETMGGKCGYLTTLAGLGAGASKIYLPEIGIKLADLSTDVMMMNKKFSYDKNEGRIILRNEESSETYTTDFITTLFNEEGRLSGLFDCRSVNLGHLQQGGAPSPLDRFRAVRFSVKGMTWLMKAGVDSIDRKKEGDIKDPLLVYTPLPQSAGLIGIKGGKVQITPILDLLPETDMDKRRPKNQWWMNLIPLLDVLTKQQ